MGGSSNPVSDVVSSATSLATDAFGNIIYDALGNPINKATGGAVSTPTKGGKFSVKPPSTSQVSNILNTTENTISNPTGTAQNQLQSGLSNAQSQVASSPETLNKAYNLDPLASNIVSSQTLAGYLPKVGNFIENQYKDVTSKFNPKLPKVSQGARQIGITDVGGKRSRRLRSASEVRNGLASTILSTPSNLLGNAGGVSQNMGKAKLGQ